MLALFDYYWVVFLTYVHWTLITEEKNHFRELAAEAEVTCMQVGSDAVCCFIQHVHPESLGVTQPRTDQF